MLSVALCHSCLNWQSKCKPLRDIEFVNSQKILLLLSPTMRICAPCYLVVADNCTFSGAWVLVLFQLVR